jgi:hypothetical protein
MKFNTAFALLVTTMTIDSKFDVVAWCDCRCDNVCNNDDGMNQITCTNFGFPCAKAINKTYCPKGVSCGKKRVTYKATTTLEDLCGNQYCNKKEEGEKIDETTYEI